MRRWRIEFQERSLWFQGLEVSVPVVVDREVQRDVAARLSPIARFKCVEVLADRIGTAQKG